MNVDAAGPMVASPSRASRHFATAVAAAVAAVVGAVSACDKGGSERAPSGSPAARPGLASTECRAWVGPTVAAVVTHSELDELSGLAASARWPGLFWTHNDGGHKPRVYLIDGSTGSVRATFKLDKAPKADWEDAAVGPCAPADPSPCLYIADTGDNERSRGAAEIVRWPEPNVLPAAARAQEPVEIAAGAWQALAFSYPDGPQDVEAMAVLTDARVVLLTKQDDGFSAVYRLDVAEGWNRAGPIASAERLGTLDLRTDGAGGQGARVTGASAAPDGSHFAVRTSATLRVFAGTGPLVGMPSALGAWPVTLLAPPSEPQGEAVSWRGVRELWTVGEGKTPPLYRYTCAP